MSDRPTVNDLLDLLSEAATEIVNLDSRQNIVAQRIRRLIHDMHATASELERLNRLVTGGSNVNL